MPPFRKACLPVGRGEGEGSHSHLPLEKGGWEGFYKMISESKVDTRYGFWAIYRSSLLWYGSESENHSTINHSPTIG